MGTERATTGSMPIPSGKLPLNNRHPSIPTWLSSASWPCGPGTDTWVRNQLNW